jgi:hypothetical protein
MAFATYLGNPDLCFERAPRELSRLGQSPQPSPRLPPACRKRRSLSSLLVAGSRNHPHPHLRSMKNSVMATFSFSCSARSNRCLPPNQGALIQRQQVVVPIPIRVCTKVRRFRRRTHDPYVRAFSGVRVQNIKRVRSRLNARDDLFTGPFPPSLWISNVSDVLVRALRMRLSNASNLNVRHWVFFAPCPARVPSGCGASGYGNPLLLP